MTGSVGDQKSTNSRVFATCFTAIVATAFCFVLRAMVVDDWGVEFALSETQKGELLGVGLWPFAITIVLLSLVIDRIGFKATLIVAATCHVAGLTVLVCARGYWSLWVGTFVMALGNGAVEAAANPAIATIYARDKPRWLNRVHAGWPAGLILGGLLAMALGPGRGWRIKVALMALPILIYVVALARTRFGVSERVAFKVSYQEMLAEAGYCSAFVVITLMMLEIGQLAGLSPEVILAAIAVLTAAYAVLARSAGRPIYVVLVLLMIPLATTELSTDSWISSLMEPRMAAMGLQAGWVLVYTSLIVLVLRLWAGPILARFKPLGVLALASGAASAGLLLMAHSTGLSVLAAASLYGAGKSFFWGTSLGVAGEQAPKGGAVALNIMAGAGMLAAGVVGSVLLGWLQDGAVARGLDHDNPAVARVYLVRRSSVLGAYRALDAAAVAAAPPALRLRLDALVARGKRSALGEVAILPALMLGAYSGLIIVFKRRGGYHAVTLGAPGSA